MPCHSAFPYTTFQTTWESRKILTEKRFLSGEKKIKKISLLFFGENVKVLKRTSPQALRNMLKPLKR